MLACLPACLPLLSFSLDALGFIETDSQLFFFFFSCPSAGLSISSSLLLSLPSLLLSYSYLYFTSFIVFFSIRGHYEGTDGEHTTRRTHTRTPKSTRHPLPFLRSSPLIEVFICGKKRKTVAGHRIARALNWTPTERQHLGGNK